MKKILIVLLIVVFGSCEKEMIESAKIETDSDYTIHLINTKSIHLTHEFACGGCGHGVSAIIDSTGK